MIIQFQSQLCRYLYYFNKWGNKLLIFYFNKWFNIKLTSFSIVTIIPIILLLIQATISCQMIEKPVRIHPDSRLKYHYLYQSKIAFVNEIKQFELVYTKPQVVNVSWDISNKLLLDEVITIRFIRSKRFRTQQCFWPSSYSSSKEM